jgi:hypothetical protein
VTAKRIRPGDLVQIEWVDSTESNGWSTLEDTQRWAPAVELLPCLSVGYLVDRHEGVTIAQSWTTDTDGKRSVADVLHVPAVAVREVELIRKQPW